MPRIVTTGQLAFACSYVPGASYEKSFQDMVTSIFGADVLVGLVASISPPLLRDRGGSAEAAGAAVD
eukprot:6455816-Amphidinium_carterae.1